MNHAERRERAINLLRILSSQTRRNSYRPILGICFALVAWTLFLLSKPIIEMLRQIAPLYILIPLHLMLIGELARRSATALHKTALDRVIKSRKPPILYLRPFWVDDPKGIVSGFPTVEYGSQEVFKRLEKIGPIIELDNPHSKRVGFGPHRVSLRAEADWQAVVTELLLCCQLVVIYVPAVSTGNLAWELARTRELVAPTRLLIRVPHVGETGRKLISSTIERWLGVTLPAWERSDFIRFDEEWRPEFISNFPRWFAMCQQLAADEGWSLPFVGCEYSTDRYLRDNG